MIEAKSGKKVPANGTRGGCLIVAVRERAVDGRVNAAIERAIAAWLECDARAVSIISDAAARFKVVEIVGVAPAVVAAKIAAVERHRRYPPLGSVVPRTLNVR